MNTTRRPMSTLLLVLLFALSTLAQQQAGLRAQPLHGCATAPCGHLDPHRLTLHDTITPLAAATVRFGVDVVRVDHRSITDANARGGVDLLFLMRSGLQLARAQASLNEYRAAALSIHAATQGTASAPSRAPPLAS